MGCGGVVRLYGRKRVGNAGFRFTGGGDRGFVYMGGGEI